MVSADEAKNPVMDAETIVANALKAAAVVAPESATPSPAVVPESTEDDVREKPPMEESFVEKIVDEDSPKEAKAGGVAVLVKPETPAIKIETTKGRSNVPHISTPAPSKDMSEAGSEKEFKKKSGLRMYLASLTARNNAKKEYLASLEESNRAKKRLLTTKKKQEKNGAPEAALSAGSTPVIEQKEELVMTTADLVEKKEQDDSLNVSQPPSTVAPPPTSPTAKPDPVGSIHMEATPPAATADPSVTSPSKVDAAGNTDVFSEISESLLSSMKHLAELESTTDAAARTKSQEDEATQRAASWNCCAW
jgi:hypothetical protein